MPVTPVAINAYIALYDYEPRTKDDLGFRKGKVVLLLPVSREEASGALGHTQPHTISCTVTWAAVVLLLVSGVVSGRFTAVNLGLSNGLVVDRHLSCCLHACSR